jgi:hypothetical protein
MAWEEETLYIGVYGTAQNGEIVIPTVYANCGRIHKGANDSEGGRPLIPAQSDILQNQIDNLGGRVAWLEATGGGGGGAGILLDTTLTQPGKAADAKATGDALKKVGGKAYVQDTEPAQMEVGEFWYNPDEDGGSIPTTLPNPHKLTFSGAVSAEYDGSEAVEVVIPQGGGGGGETKPVYLGTIPVNKETSHYAVAPIKDYKKVLIVKERTAYVSTLKTNLFYGIMRWNDSNLVNQKTIGYQGTPGYKLGQFCIGVDAGLLTGWRGESNNENVDDSFKIGAVRSTNGVFNRIPSLNFADIDMEKDYYGFYAVDPTLAFDGNETVHVWGWPR